MVTEKRNIIILNLDVVQFVRTWINQINTNADNLVMLMDTFSSGVGLRK